MGTTISMLLPEERAAEAVASVQHLFAVWEECLSRFRPDSELSRLNQRSGAPVQVSPLLFHAVSTALAAARATDGLYDPTLQHQMAQLGYDRSFETLPASLPDPNRPILPGGGWRVVSITPADRTVLLPPGVGFDFGGIGKGMAVDAALAQLRALGIRDALVNAGGDLAVLGLPPEGDSWPIEVPSRHGHWVVPLRQGAIATSGVARRHWQQGAQARHHLLDPRTGLPSQSGLWSVSVAAATCAQAEVAAKAAFILGRTAGAAFLQAQRLAGVLVHEQGAWRAVGAWPVGAEEV